MTDPTAAPRAMPYSYDGPEALRAPLLAALQRVVDPELALSIVDVGLIRGVTVTAERIHLVLTMTSAACPVTDAIVDDVGVELDKVAPPGMPIDVELVWAPPWSAEHMSARAKSFMGW